MAHGLHPFEAFLSLPELDRVEDRRTTFRTSFADLAAVISDRRIPAPLEGLDVTALTRSVDVAVADGSFVLVDWLADDVVKATIYEIASAIAPGQSKRYLGGIIADTLENGRGSSFASVATQAVLASSLAWMRRPPVRARIALAMSTPRWLLPQADALALAIISRRELAQELLVTNSHGSLSARRTAARMLERASAEAARRAASGDAGGIRIFGTPWVRQAFERLLADREPLVWRHVAIARGQLSATSNALLDEIRADLSPRFGITEWRRAAVSLAASALVRPGEALAECGSLLRSELIRLDRGLAAAIVHGLAATLGVDAVDLATVLTSAVGIGGLEAVEALVQIARRASDLEPLRIPLEVGRGVVQAITRATGSFDEGQRALADHLDDQITPLLEGRRPNDLPAAGEAALELFAETGPASALDVGVEMLGRAAGLVRALGSLDLTSPLGRAASYRMLRDVDASLLETEVFGGLVALAGATDAESDRATDLLEVRRRLSDWLVAQVLAVDDVGARGTLDVDRVRTLLHLVDADAAIEDESGDRVRLLRALLPMIRRRVRPVQRVLCATLARTLDALVREGACDSADALVVLAAASCSPPDFSALAEASMVPELETLLEQAGRTVESARDWTASPESTASASESLQALADAIPVAETRRVDALRMALLGMSSALMDLASVRSLTDLRSADAQQVLEALRINIGQLLVLSRGAHLRLLDGPFDIGPWSDGLVPLEQARRGDDASAVGAALERLGPLPSAEAGLAGLVFRAVGLATSWVARLPEVANHAPLASLRPKPIGASLPGWLPVHRTLGSYYVVRTLGSGAAGTVFEARRFEDRQRMDAPAYALKVPDYDSAAARTLSEAQFLAMFREEAAALLSLPSQPHLARFEAFDATAKPKPVLAMELVRGRSLDDILASAHLGVVQALDWLDGIASGLETMHAVGLAHLDVKPSNIIVRDGGAHQPGVAVLVDFGLAGRRIRPGCGTPNYAAPEVFVTGASDTPDAAAAVDVYAFCCLAFEVFTGRCLFDAEDLNVLVTMHFDHDGWPPLLRRLGEDHTRRPLAELLSHGLRTRSEARPTIRALRTELVELRRGIMNAPWPL